MAHSKWEVIRLKKGKVDSAKNSIYTRHARAIMLAARQGDPDPASNFRLRSAVEKARVAGLPSENIERAIKKGSGQLAGDELESIRYEGYGPGGVAVLMEILTDNRNRTAAEVREAFSKVGGSLGETGCVSWMFAQKGVIKLAGTVEEEALLMGVAEAGGEDFRITDDGAEVICDYQQLESVATHLGKAGWRLQETEIPWIPQNWVRVEEAELAKRVLLLMDKLDSLDDVQNVFANFELDDSALDLDTL